MKEHSSSFVSPLAQEASDMPDVNVHRVASRRQRKQFLEFPWTLYQGDPNWIPPLRGSQKELVGYAPHPFYDRNSIQTFLAYRGGEVCGRIAAILNRGHNDRYGERRGFFGFFECIDDQEAANGLFDAVRQWFADQGIHCLRGPANPSLNYEVGLLVEGFDSPPTFMMTYNPPYYARLIESYGFRKTQDLYAYWGHIDMLPPIAAKLVPVAEQIIERYNVRLRPLDKSRFLRGRADVPVDLQPFAGQHVGFCADVATRRCGTSAKGLQYMIVPELAIAGGGRRARWSARRSACPTTTRGSGRSTAGCSRSASSACCERSTRSSGSGLISTNVIPEYQLQGVGLVMMRGLIAPIQKFGVEEVEFSWVLESNRLSRGSLEKGGAKRTKTYRLYDLDQKV